MERFYSLTDFQFMATPSLDAFYVIALATDGGLPMIVRRVALDAPERKGISFQLERFTSDGPALTIREGNMFVENGEVEMLSAGKVLVQTASYREDHKVVQLNAYFNGGMVDTTNFTVTVAGIGITDILATDPLTVSLVKAPLTTIPVYNETETSPVDRAVVGVFLDYQPLPFNSLTGALPASVVEVLIAVERTGSL